MVIEVKGHPIKGLVPKVWLAEHSRGFFQLNMGSHLRQVITQAFMAFHTYPDQAIIYHSLIIGVYFSLFEFKRPEELEQLPRGAGGVVTALTSELGCNIRLKASQALEGENELDDFYQSYSSSEMDLSQSEVDSEAGDPSYTPSDP
ncbi:uncharacterized protein EI90DRAFT_3019427 [Cantharellus anzutake]|uniref:uncharacterized protein n=1 Tax=Cantharellus anzutake TaxID=1750568 RepID=UPI0019062EDF|nr:uncharacterized protein EI90DRAFT_3019427 [Cantharellus anzutake]KAF8324663.1 hypothetical protein EI90DRAFT_3019427 [Cantharellus anzutake]